MRSILCLTSVYCSLSHTTGEDRTTRRLKFSQAMYARLRTGVTMSAL